MQFYLYYKFCLLLVFLTLVVSFSRDIILKLCCFPGSYRQRLKLHNSQTLQNLKAFENE